MIALAKRHESINDATRTRAGSWKDTSFNGKVPVCFKNTIIMDIKLQNTRAIETLSRRFAVSL